MYLQNNDIERTSGNIKRLFRYCVDRIGVQDLCEVLNVDTKFIRIALKGSIKIGADSLINSAEKMGVGVNSIIYGHGPRDLDCVIEKLSGNTNYIPKDFLVNARSKIKTFNFISNYNSNAMGLLPFSIENEFQIGDDYRLDPENQISVDLLVDTLNYIESQFGGKKSSVSFQIGLEAAKDVRETLVGNSLIAEKSLKSRYEKFFEDCIPFFESNFHYEIIKSNHKEFIVESKVSEAGKLIGSESLCSYKLGLLRGIANFNGKKNVSIFKTKSLYSGDDVNRYLISVA